MKSCCFLHFIHQFNIILSVKKTTSKTKNYYLYNVKYNHIQTIPTQTLLTHHIQIHQYTQICIHNTQIPIQTRLTQTYIQKYTDKHS